MKRAAAIALLLVAGCRDKKPQEKPLPGPRPAERTVQVPRAAGAMRLDGELDEPEWAGALRSGAFVDAQGKEARPFSEARLAWGDGKLYLGLYAADDDLRASERPRDAPVWLDDAFRMRFDAGGASYLVDVSAAGKVSDAKVAGRVDPGWDSGIELAVDRDGSLNDPADDDEEWVVEAALPLASLGVAPKLALELK